jgi:hypothetical protein
VHSEAQLFEDNMISITQSIALCPKTKYTVTGYAYFPNKHEASSCSVYICSSSPDKCETAEINEVGVWNPIQLSFKTGKNGGNVDVQAYVECFGEDTKRVNTVLLDNFRIT